MQCSQRLCNVQNAYDRIVTKKKNQDNDCTWRMDVTQLKKKKNG